jgi:hypothetical protein
MDWTVQGYHRIDMYSGMALCKSVHGEGWMVRVRSWGRDTDLRFEDEGDAHKTFDRIVAGFSKHRAAVEKEE